ncbi:MULTISPECIES: hypothetical protein [unclassified Sphingomonas]|nr:MULTISPECIES: hypothetical protein [unclassified Sphingomonas]
MATTFPLPNAQTRRRIKKVARPNDMQFDAAAVVNRLYAQFPIDMERLAE